MKTAICLPWNINRELVRPVVLLATIALNVPQVLGENLPLILNSPPGGGGEIDVSSQRMALAELQRKHSYREFGVFGYTSPEVEHELGSPLMIPFAGANLSYCDHVTTRFFIEISAGLEPLKRGDATIEPPNSSPASTLPLDLALLGWKGEARIYDESNRYELQQFLYISGAAKGGLWLGVKMQVKASGHSRFINLPDVPAIQQSVEKGRLAAATPYLNDEWAKALACLKTLQINPAAYLIPAKEEKLGEQLEFMPDPASKTALLADGKDGLYLKARSPARPGEKPADADKLTQQISFSAEGQGNQWVDFGKPTSEGGWRRIYLQASNPDKVRNSVKMPEKLTITASLTEGSKTASKSIQISITPNAEIDARPDVVDFTIKSGQTAQVKVWLDHAGIEKWAFRTQYAKKSRALAQATIKATDANHAILTLKEAGLDPLHDGSNKEYADLSIIAEQKGREPLERIIKVGVSQEGLFVDPRGKDEATRSYKANADGKGVAKDIDFRIFAPDPKTGRIENLTKSAEVLKSVIVECLEPPQSTAGRLMEAGKLEWGLAGIRPSNQPSAILRLRFGKELPSDGRVVPCEFRISYTGAKDESYTAIVKVGIQTTADGPGGKDWQIELERCQTIIRKFVPLSYQGKLTEMLNQRSRTLGPEGLKALRSRIWSAAQLLTMAEGGRGYEDEARWANYITETLDWTQWAGDIAFQAAIGTVTGPYGSIGASMLKGFVIGAIDAYQEGQTAEQWLWGNLVMVYGVAEGKVVDPEFFAQMGVESKAKVWGIFISYHFLKNLYNGETVVDALKKTAFEVGSNRLGAWLSDEVKKNPNRNVGDWAAEKAKNAIATAKAGVQTPTETTSTGAQRPVVVEAVTQVRKGMTKGPDGKTYARHSDVLEIMRDPSKVRALKAGPPDAREAFNNTREALYRQHDAQVVQHIKETMSDMKYRMVRVLEFRTPGQRGDSLNTDRDYRVCYWAGRDPVTGRDNWVEIPRKHWENKSYRTFAELTGGPADDPVRSREWAAEHQQLATDKSHIEASRAFSDQATVWNPKTKKFEPVRVVSNVSEVKGASGEGPSIDDPHSLGKMYEVKVADARFKHEAIVQANKAVGTFIELRKAYNQQGRDIGELPPKLRAGMDAISEARSALERDPNQRDPVAIAKAERLLRENGFSSLNDFMRALGAQFEALKLMR